MSLRYIIDGYNVIHHPLFSSLSQTRKGCAAGKLYARTAKKAGAKASQDIRASLLGFIRTHKLTKDNKNKVTVVFDGHYNAEYKESSNVSGIEVVFSREQTADERIKKMIEDSGNPQDMIAVSDDKEIKFFAKAAGAQWISVEEFIGRRQEPKQAEDLLLKQELSYTQIQRINQELQRIWLK